MMIKKAFVPLLLAATLAASAAAAAQETFSSEYRIGPQDLLEISVYGDAEMQGLLVRVSEEGRITLPLLREVDVDNLTRAEIEERLARLLIEKNLFQNPQVTVFIKEYLSKRVSVMGAVGAPGLYQLVGRQTLLWIISQAGGLTPEAGDEIIVMRPAADGSTASLRISIDDLFFKGDPKFNIPLEPRDIVNIPVDKPVTIYVMGQVKTPGALQVKKSNIPTLVQAIAQAGGFAERAAKGSVVIKRRGPDGEEQQIKVNVKDILKDKIKDVPLQPNDTIYVPETIF